MNDSSIDFLCQYMPTGNFELQDRMIHWGDYFAVLANPYESNIQVNAKIIVYDRTKTQVT